MSRIVVLGDLNLDVYATHPDRLPPGAERRSNVWAEAGGSAGTFARVAARQGACVTFVGAVGEDLVGDLLIQSLERDGIRPAIKRSPLPSGIILALDQGDDRAMICSRGANDGLHERDIQASLLRKADHLHVSGYAILSDPQRAAAQRAIRLAADLSLTVSLDPPPANLISSFGASAFLDAIEGVVWLFPNRSEGQTLTGLRQEAEIVEALGGRFSAGALTLGTEGALAWRQEERSHQSPAATVVANPTGAGDAFAAGFVTALLSGRSLTQANANGCACAAAHLEVSRSRRTTSP